MRTITKVVALFWLLLACNPGAGNRPAEQKNKPMLSKEAQKVRDYVKQGAVIAHRGSTYWAPEETEPAYRWARNIGADYLELDLQMTKDGFLVAFHDDDLTRTTNVATVFPERAQSPVKDFTLQELRSLDAGSWFAARYPQRARDSFAGQPILTLQDVIMIAEGYRIKWLNGEPVKAMPAGEWTGLYEYEPDPADNGNRPGVYAETKVPGAEEALATELKRLGWLITANPKAITTTSGKVGIANTKGRFVLQSFIPESIEKLERLLPGLPKCLLLWYPAMEDSLEANYARAIAFAVRHNAHFIGPSIAGGPNNYGELTAPAMTAKIHAAGLYIHPYTFDTRAQLTAYKNRVEGVFTNRADLALQVYGRPGHKAAEILTGLGY